jgi:hypothetical protein
MAGGARQGQAAGPARAAIRARRRRSPIRTLRDWLDHRAARERLAR